MKAVTLKMLAFMTSLGLIIDPLFAASYNLKPIDLPVDDNQYVTVYDVSDNNDLIGAYEVCRDENNCVLHGFLYDSGGKMIELKPLNGHNISDPFSISPSGNNIVGKSYVENFNNSQAILWDLKGNVKKVLALPEGRNYSGAHAVNDEGYAVGYANTGEDDIHATLWDTKKNTVIKELEIANNNRFMGIIPNGAVGVGYRQLEEGSESYAAIVWYPGQPLRDFERLPDGHFVNAYAINDAGIAVGGAEDSEFIPHAVFWNKKDVKLNNMGALEGDIGAIAADINNAGQIVGMSGVVFAPRDKGKRKHEERLFTKKQMQAYYSLQKDTTRDLWRGFIYENGKMTDLNELVDDMPEDVRIAAGNKITHRGTILAVAHNIKTGELFDVLLIPNK